MHTVLVLLFSDRKDETAVSKYGTNVTHENSVPALDGLANGKRVVHATTQPKTKGRREHYLETNCRKCGLHCTHHLPFLFHFNIPLPLLRSH